MPGMSYEEPTWRLISLRLTPPLGGSTPGRNAFRATTAPLAGVKRLLNRPVTASMVGSTLSVSATPAESSTSIGVTVPLAEMFVGEGVGTTFFAPFRLDSRLEVRNESS